jgi:hypothetical protein
MPLISKACKPDEIVARDNAGSRPKLLIKRQPTVLSTLVYVQARKEKVSFLFVLLWYDLLSCQLLPPAEDSVMQFGGQQLLLWQRR